MDDLFQIILMLTQRVDTFSGQQSLIHPFLQLKQGVRYRPSLAIWVVSRKHIECVSHRNDLRCNWDRLFLQTVRITRTIKVFVLVRNHLQKQRHAWVNWITNTRHYIVCRFDTLLDMLKKNRLLLSRVTCSTTGYFYRQLNIAQCMMTSDVVKPMPAEARGRASIPAPIVVPAIIRVLPNTLERLIVYLSLHLIGSYQHQIGQRRTKTDTIFVINTILQDL